MPPPYPPLHLALPDGTPVVLRPVRGEDRRFLVEGLARLSPRSRQTRFFAALDHLTEAQLRYLTEVDQEHHVAWGALTDEEEPVGLGVARFARLAEDPSAAEVAVTVIDAYQHRGLGTLLLAVLYLVALRLGVERFQAFVLLENEALVRGLRSLGAALGRHEEGATEMSLPVLPPEDLPDTAAARHFRAYLRRVAKALEASGQPSQKEA